MTKAVVEEAESGEEHRRERESVAQAVRMAFQIEEGMLPWGGVQQGRENMVWAGTQGMCRHSGKRGERREETGQTGCKTAPPPERTWISSSAFITVVLHVEISWDALLVVL